jgi:hypothetical protein
MHYRTSNFAFDLHFNILNVGCHGMMISLRNVLLSTIIYSCFILSGVSMKLSMIVPRLFVPIRCGPARPQNELARLRILQYNILADGLSGLREDMGGFSRAKREHLDWKRRKGLILKEILSYEPDVISLQECDHFHDYFQPELGAAGYTGIFAPKPISACLEVSNSSDGCAIFVKRSKVSIDSTEVGLRTVACIPSPDEPSRNVLQVLTYALPQHLTWDEALKGVENRDETLSKFLYSEKQNLWRFLRVQNQVALIAKCSVVSSTGAKFVPLLIATTHLKVSGPPIISFRKALLC